MATFSWWRTAFRAAQDLEAAPFLGEAWFFRALADLGGGADRLVETKAGRPLPAAPPLGDAQASPGCHSA